MYTKNSQYNDQIGSRGRRNFLLVFDAKNDVLFRWNCETVPGVILAGKSEYEKRGKWSNTTYYFQTPDHVQTHRWEEGFESGKYFEEEFWSEQIKRIQGFFKADQKPSAEAVERFMRATFPNTSNRFDEAEKTRNSQEDGGAVLKAQQELIAEIKMQIAQEQAKIAAQEQEKADALKLEKVNANSMKLKKGMSLQELQELLKDTEDI
jgi:hypothetical protein